MVRCFLQHAATVHTCDLNVGIHVLDRLSSVSSIEEPVMGDLATGLARHASPESTLCSTTDVMSDATRDLTMSGTKTPASPMESDIIHKIYLRLL